MKFYLSEEQRQYLNAVMVTVTNSLSVKDVDSGVARTIHKMRYKFTTNAVYSNLTNREKEFILNAMLFRLNKIGNLATNESAIIEGVIKCLTK